MKYEILPPPIPYGDITLYRIKAAETCGDVKEGDLGGLVEGSDNLAQSGCAWLYGEAKAYGGGKLSDCAKARDNAEIKDGAWLRGCAEAEGNAVITNGADVSGLVSVGENAKVSGARLSGLLRVYGDNVVTGDNWG